MSDSVQVTTSTSWFNRLRDALFGLVGGVVLVPAAIIGLFWNEGNAINTARALNEGSGAVIEAAPGAVDPALLGKLVHVTGPLVIAGDLKDAAFGVIAPGATQLIRAVEMFQWVQHESSTTRDKLGGGKETVTTYRYAQEWSDGAQDSAKFKEPTGHANPPMRVAGDKQIATQGKLGAYTVDAAVLTLLGPPEPMPLTTLPAGARGTRLANDGLYQGADPANPALGDLRVHFSVVHPATASVIAKQDGAALHAYTTTNGRSLLMAKSGAVDAPAMFQEAKNDNVVATWLIRAVGCVAMLIGFYLLFRPLEVLASVIPFLGSLVGAGAGLMALLLTLVVAPVTIAIGWLVVRPLLGGAILAVAVVGLIGLVRAVRRRPARVVMPSVYVPAP